MELMDRRYSYRIFSTINKPKKGPLPNYSAYHGIMAFFILGDGPIGRKALAERLAIGEGTARTLIEKLYGLGLVSASAKGCQLTKKGDKMLMDIKKRVSYKPHIAAGPITIGKANVAVLIKRTANMIKSGMEQRDAAITAGTMGASTIILDEGGPRIAMIAADENMQAHIRVLCEDMKMEKGDVLIIGTGETEKEAERAAWAAAYTVLERM